MISVVNEKDNWTIKFDNNEISKEFILQLIKKAQIENILQKSTLSDDMAFEISEEMKESWWNDNKDRLFKKYGIDDANYH